MLTSEVINIARAHLGEGSMVGSAKIALQDAAQMYSRGLLADAKDRARQSLKYSVGILHPDYQRTLEITDEAQALADFQIQASGRLFI